MNARAVALGLALAVAAGGACKKSSPSEPEAKVTGGAPTPLPSGSSVVEDTSPKEAPRLVPPEAFVRSYLALFGGLSPLDAQKAARASDTQLFDGWDDYLSSLGFPEYRLDLPRGTQTNALMLATFERVGIALCDRAVQNDLEGSPAPPASQRVIFAFDEPAGDVDATAFQAPFDVLHRTFLGYPAALAPTDRTSRFFQLYQDTVARHAAKGAPKSKFATPAHAGWAAVCYGLIRHPEFHLY